MKSWRERLGVQQPEPDPAAGAARMLTESGIETEQRPYVLPAAAAITGSPALFRALPTACGSPFSSGAATSSAPRTSSART